MGTVTMTQFKHTPGPWVAVGTEVVSIASKTVICETPQRKMADAMNRKLIAAAPDMLAVLDAVRINMKSHDRTPHEERLYEAVRVTIAKAEGQ